MASYSAESDAPVVREVIDWLESLSPPIGCIPQTTPNTFALSRPPSAGPKVLLEVRTLGGSLQERSPPPAADRTAPFDRRVILWEDLWHTRRGVVQSRLLASVGVSERIPARMTSVRRIDRPTALRFLAENHLQVPLNAKLNYGLFLPGRYFRVLSAPPDAAQLLVAVATFARPRRMPRAGVVHESHELVRFASLRRTTVVGGLGKLLNHFAQQHRPDDLMTYADRDWSDGRSYRRLGFEEREVLPPQRFWVDPGSMARYYPHRLPNGWTEQEAAGHGFLKVNNSGSIKFIKPFTTQPL